MIYIYYIIVYANINTTVITNNNIKLKIKITKKHIN